MADDGKVGDAVDAPWVGAIPAGSSLASVIRIPVPGTNNLAIELAPRNYKGQTTSSIFIQNGKGKRVLRLDYGFNVKTNTVDFHWNQKGTFEDFGIADHTTVGGTGSALYRGAKAFRYAGRFLVVVGAVMDIVSIAQASNPLRRSTQVISAWAAAWIAARGAGALGAELGTAVEPGLGTAAGGIVFGFVGGAFGYWAGNSAGAVIYDWAANTTFTPLMEEPFAGQYPGGVLSDPAAGGTAVPWHW